ncbi:MAG: DUF4091 domain-containing protein [Lentisphaeria bacterium]|nr:DUF4091 domain-containing protein [Lentisphaeria bacterium]
MMKNTHFAVLLMIMALELAAVPWHYPQYLDHNIPHRQRRAIIITNKSDAASDGDMLFVSIKELGLAGKPSKDVRLVDDNGMELMYAIHPEGATLSEDGSIVVPVKADAGQTVTLWLYWDNPLAWDLPDKLRAPLKTFSDSFEDGNEIAPPGWRSAMTDDKHVNARSDTVAHSGRKSVMTTVLDGANPSWVQFGRSFAVQPDSRYVMRCWVKGENIEGSKYGAGFYAHIGPSGNVGRDPKNAWFNTGTFDWKQIEMTGVVPDDANTMNFGTVMHATKGTAWFDDVELLFETKDQFEYKLGNVEKMEIAEPKHNKAWEADASQWPERYLLAAYNVTDEPMGERLCAFQANRVVHANYPSSAYKVFVNGKHAPHIQAGDVLVFKIDGIAPRSSLPISIYLAKDRQNQISDAQAAQNSLILSDLEAKGTERIDKESYATFLESSVNLVKNPSFETDEVWHGGENGRIEEGGLFGKRMGVIEAPKSQMGWHGLYQEVPIKTGHTYLMAGWVNSEKLCRVWAHEYEKGKPSPFTNIFVDVPGSGWRPFATTVTGKFPNSVVEIHLTSNKPDRLEYDGLLLAEVLPLSKAVMESQSDLMAKAPLRAMQVDTIRKVFQDTPVEDKPCEAAIWMAQGESEPLQLAVRASSDIQILTFYVSEPRDENGNKGPSFGGMCMGSYAKVDSESRYNSFTNLPVYGLCVPSDCLPELYPDALMPVDGKKIVGISNMTSGFQMLFTTDYSTKPGVYRGVIYFMDGKKTLLGKKILLKVPYKVTVWPFKLPKNNLTAIFDNRFWKGSEHKRYTPMQLATFLGQSYKLGFDEIPSRPVFKLVDGKVTADFRKFDENAQFLLKQLDVMPRLYLPIFREHFGWGRPPANFLGVKPYPGEWPYEGVDRGKFTDEYKRVCQEALKLMMQHLRDMGLEDRFLLYVADEPHENVPGIKEQMIALCDMFHEAWPTVKIYSSTWRYVPEWLGKIDVWGIGVQGQVTPEQFKIMKDAGAEFLITTDGQMCIDTPYNAIERLLPLYAWKHGLLGYEYWGADWFTHDPLEWGIHTVHFESDRPGHTFRVRYPNADGYVIYPSPKALKDKPILSSVRLEALRDGVEDYAYYTLLEKLANEKNDADAKKLLEDVKALVFIPNAGGRKSEHLLPQPERLSELRRQVGEAIARLMR